MKFVVVSAALLLIASILMVSVSGASLGDGRPGCKTPPEIETKYYRNLWDPTAYWNCSTINVPASAVRCPDEEAFIDTLKKCVPWDDWTWETLQAPPSTP